MDCLVSTFNFSTFQLELFNFQLFNFSTHDGCMWNVDDGSSSTSDNDGSSSR